MRNSTKKPGRGRGRPPTYDRDKALEAIRDVFWGQGFSAASLDNVSKATGMTRPSLYGAFGDKRSMYVAALSAMRADFEENAGRIFDEEVELAGALRRFYAGAIDMYLSGEAGPRGCLFVCTATAEAHNESSVKEALAQMLEVMDDTLTAWFERALARNELVTSSEPAELAKISSGVLHSVAVRARAGASRETLVNMTEAWIDLLHR